MTDKSQQNVEYRRTPVVNGNYNSSHFLTGARRAPLHHECLPHDMWPFAS